MSNKLYTEEQLFLSMDFARGYNKMSDTQFIETLKPLELPSDEEIDKLSLYKPTENVPYNPIMNIVWIEGAKWMRDKIQGGKNEQ